MPIADKLIVLTRSKAGNHAWAPRIRALGVKVYELPTILTAPVEITPDVKTTLEALPDFDWVVFTSSTGVRYLRKLADQLELTWPPDGPRIAAVGSETGNAAANSGMHISFQPTRPSSTELANELPEADGKRVLIPRTTIASDELATILTSRGAQVIVLPVYETHTIDTPDEVFLEKLRADEVGIIVFGSPSAVHGFCEQVRGDLLAISQALPAVAIGPGVADALHKAGFTEIHVSSKTSIDGVVEIIQLLVR